MGPKPSASQRKHPVEPHDAVPHIQDELTELSSVSRTCRLPGTATMRRHSLAMTVPVSMRHNEAALTG